MSLALVFPQVRGARGSLEDERANTFTFEEASRMA